MVTKNNIPSSNKRRYFVALLVTLFLILLGVSLYKLNQRSNTNNPVGANETDGINLNPPTDEEKKAGDARKQEISAERRLAESQPSSGSGASSKKTVSVIITDASQYDDIIEVRSFIPDHYQDGTCTISFRKDDRTLTKTTPAYRDISTTICTNPNIKRSEFSTSGEWQVTVSYESADAKGTSNAQTITIK